jgi:TonB-linked SusC/RagA family outer membrane protein
MKKCWLTRCVFTRESLHKYLLLMKLTALLLLIACMQVSARGYSQDKMSVSLKDVKLKYAITYIQHNSKYRFIYSDDLFPETAKVSVEARDATIQQVLDIMFRSTSLIYRVMNDNLIVIASQADNMPAFTVKGKVTLHHSTGISAAGPGISVVEKGTTNGTTTNDQGEFSLEVKDANAVLVISSVGYDRQEVAVGGRQEVSILLEPTSAAMADVVVTALGITRQKKSVTYATQSIKGSDLADTREVNVTDAMDGKVANMLLSKTNAGPGSSTRIIFRGNRSINGSNQPLIIVDGVRIDNTPQAFNDVTANVSNARDNGDGISNINPDDIESMTVLTGASAAALYGSDASNGAIIITTKKGRSGKGVGISVSSSAMFENPMVLPHFQNTYGEGSGGIFDPKSEYSWGPKMTGQSVTDWTGKSQPLSPQADNFKDFFRTGSEFINSVALSGGGDKSQTYFSYTNTYSNGIMPNNGYKRNNLNLRQTYRLTDKLSVDIKANYINEDIVNRPMAGAGNHAMATLYSMPRSLRLKDIKNYEYTDLSDFTLHQNYWGSQQPAFQNPYWSVNRNLYERDRDRLIGLVALKYQITPELSVQGRTSLDTYQDYATETDYSNTYWITYAGGGNYEINKSSFRQFNNDLLINYNKRLNDKFSLTVNAGASLEQFNMENTNSNDQGLIVANSFSLGNGLATVTTNGLSRTQKQSVYAAANVGYKDYLFLDVTGRNDWNSTLPVDHASYFFPSVGLSAVFNEMFSLPTAISLLKLRGSYAEVGNGTGFNQLQESPYIGPGGNGGFLYVDRVLKDADLKPEQTKSYEVGLDLGLFKNRFTAEVTGYKTNTINQILSIGVPSPSGYAFRIINAGNIRNEGLELLLTGKPIDGAQFKWTIGFNFGLNRNKILYLDSIEKMPPLSSPETLGEIVAEEGKAYGGIYTTSFMRTATGQVIVDSTGLPEVQGDQTKHYAGNYNPDWTAGITNTFQYKNWGLSFLIDMRKGGIVISGTQALMASQGVTKNTLTGRENGFVVPNSVTEGGGKNTVAISAQDYWQWVGSQNLVGEAFVNSATNIRLRQASLSYTLPLSGRSAVKGATFSLIGRNLFFLKNDAVGFDPESALGTGNNQGLEYTPVPSTRSYGLYVKLNF